ncbi:MAG: GNAT family N-acetyltransferase [Candidatus Limnocylindrales bacterium]
MAAYRRDAPRHKLPADLDVRPASHDDCAAIAAIEASRDSVDVSQALRWCEKEVSDAGMLLLVAAVDGQVIGFGRAARLARLADAPPDAVPEGWYLLGVVVVDAWRRRGVGRVLTERRLAWIAQRGDAAYYFTNARNGASLDLHRALGFVEVTRRFSAPRITFDGGEGVLSRIDLAGARRAEPI